LDIEENLDTFAALVEIIAKLRSPEGCPWDRAQTHASIKGNLVEETYEVLEAIDEQDMSKLCEELGDLLMQIVLQSQMASEDKDFEISDVVRKINEKLIRRHPHVFGDAKAEDAKQVITNWEALKREEGKGSESTLDGVPMLLRSWLRKWQSLKRQPGTSNECGSLAICFSPWPTSLASLTSTLRGRCDGQTSASTAASHIWSKFAKRGASHWRACL